MAPATCPAAGLPQARVSAARIRCTYDAMTTASRIRLLAPAAKAASNWCTFRDIPSQRHSRANNNVCACGPNAHSASP